MDRSDRDSSLIGLAVTTQSLPSTEGQVFSYRPDGLEPFHGFSIKVGVGWRSLVAEFIAEPYAGILLAKMQSADERSRSVLWKLAEKYRLEGAEFRFALDGVPVRREEEGTWDGDWSALSMALESPPMSISNPDYLAAEWAAKLFAIVLAILPVADEAEPLTNGAILAREEGETRWQAGLARTRSTANRMACIQLRGTRCLACDTDLGETYGELGDGFIEVHHVVPIAAFEGVRLVDPEKDLAPVCPNCHAILHRTTPPMQIDALRALVAEKRHASQVRK